MPPKAYTYLKMYWLATNTTIGSMLAQENDEGKEWVMYYLSRMLNDIEKRYTAIEKLCLFLYFACTKLWHYLLSTTIHVIYKMGKVSKKSSTFYIDTN